MKPPVFPAHPAPAQFGALWRLDPAKAKEAAELNAYLLARMISDRGITVNCVPMLDVPQPDADPTVIGDRALAQHQDIIAELGQSVIDGTITGGALPVIKHMPGHGRALCDSHHELPKVCARNDDLEAVDYMPFKALSSAKMGMTGHVVYEACDAEQPATLSKIIVNDVIRGAIGFEGLLFTDDLRMKALSGNVASRVKGSYEAGCDIALCCNFTLGEKKESANALKEIDGKTKKRAESAMGELVEPDRQSVDELYQKLEQLLKPVSA